MVGSASDGNDNVYSRITGDAFCKSNSVKKGTTMTDSATQAIIEDMELYGSGDYEVAPTHEELRSREYHIMSLKFQQKQHMTYTQNGIEVNKGERALAYHVAYLQTDAVGRAHWFDKARDWQDRIRRIHGKADNEIGNGKLEHADNRVAETEAEMEECAALLEAGLAAYNDIVGYDWVKPTKNPPVTKPPVMDRTAYDDRDMSKAELTRDKLLGERSSPAPFTKQVTSYSQ